MMLPHTEHHSEHIGTACKNEETCLVALDRAATEGNMLYIPREQYFCSGSSQPASAFAERGTALSD